MAKGSGRGGNFIPQSLVLPTRAFAKQLSTAQTGEIAVSGAKLVFFDGTGWKVITSA